MVGLGGVLQTPDQVIVSLTIGTKIVAAVLPAVTNCLYAFVLGTNERFYNVSCHIVSLWFRLSFWCLEKPPWNIY